jgi:hypothetical protein
MVHGRSGYQHILPCPGTFLALQPPCIINLQVSPALAPSTYSAVASYVSAMSLCTRIDNKEPTINSSICPPPIAIILSHPSTAHSFTQSCVMWFPHSATKSLPLRVKLIPISFSIFDQSSSVMLGFVLPQNRIPCSSSLTRPGRCSASCATIESIGRYLVDRSKQRLAGSPVVTIEVTAPSPLYSPRPCRFLSVARSATAYDHHCPAWHSSR